MTSSQINDQIMTFNDRSLYNNNEHVVTLFAIMAISAIVLQQLKFRRVYHNRKKSAYRRRRNCLLAALIRNPVLYLFSFLIRNPVFVQLHTS